MSGLYRRLAAVIEDPSQWGPTNAVGTFRGVPQPTTPDAQEEINITFVHVILYTWFGLIGSILAYRLILLLFHYVRILSCMGSDKQHFFLPAIQKHAFFKKHFVDAPLFRKRHNREFKLSAAINIGTLPTRFQTLALTLYIAMNIAFCVVGLPFNGSRGMMLLKFRHRSGTIAGFNMVPLFLLAGRRNPLIRMLDISFDAYNLIHRWLGRLTIIQALLHTAAHIAMIVETRGGWSVFLGSIATEQTIYTGIIAVVAWIILLTHSPSAIRHAYYETFLHVHILLAFVSVIVLWYHVAEVPYVKPFIAAAMAAWALERAGRFYNILRNNVGAGGTTAEVEALPGDALRVTLHIARPWKFQPGQYVFLYMPTIGWWTNHPFSVAWSDDHDELSEKGVLPMDRTDIMSFRKTTMSLVIRRRTGFTDRLWSRASASPDGRFHARAYVEGPYGSHNLSSYGTVMLFAAGVGITHQIPFLRSLIEQYNDGSGACRRVTLVWIIQSPEHLEWIRPWMTDILGMNSRRDVLKIQLFITRPRSTKEIHSPSSSVQMFPGKPDVEALVTQQQQTQIGAMAVSVCGTGSLADDVRRACRMRCQITTIDFVENAFSW